MTTVWDIAAPLAEVCVPVPFAFDGVCERCHNHPRSGYQICYSCFQVERQVSRPCQLVVPISLYEIPSQLHHYLRHYKSDRYPDRKHEFALKAVALLCTFLLRHRLCIASDAGGDWDLITSVPSSSGRQGEHPLVTALRSVPTVFETYEHLLKAGSTKLEHNRASDKGFDVTRSLHGERVLLIDDTYTTGARSQSAASALNNGGGQVVAIVPVGRVINPEWADVGEWWSAQKRQAFRFDTCCLEPF